MLEKIIQYLRDEEGQTSTEYILLLTVVAMIVFKFRKVATARLEGLTNSVFDKADQAVQEGLNQ